MPLPSTLEVCQQHLFDSVATLEENNFKAVTIKGVLRIRDMYAYFLENPDTKDRQFVEEDMARHGISRSEAYSDLAIIKALLPHFIKATRDFYRWRVNEMLIETFNMAKKRKDTRTMEKAATSLGKLNRIDLEDEQTLPFNLIVVQPFVATMDPRVLGIEPIENLDDVISGMIQKYAADTIDINDVSYEEADLEENIYFPEIQDAEWQPVVDDEKSLV